MTNNVITLSDHRPASPADLRQAAPAFDPDWLEVDSEWRENFGFAWNGKAFDIVQT